MVINFKPLPKQWEALQFLNDDSTTEVLYGGSAGSGKSELGCAWILMNCISMPGSRWLIGREKLSVLKSTTMKSFLDVASKFGLIRGTHFRWSNNSNELKFFNGSEIILRELFSYPSDPDFDSLGSLEITGAFIDEVSQIDQKAKDVVKSRIRYKLDLFGIVGKLLMTTNPSKNFAYHQFYKPNRDGTIEPFRKFIPALPTDNPFLPKTYIDSLKQLDRVQKNRLFYGLWEYEEDELTLMNFDKIEELFRNRHIQIIDNEGITIGTRYKTQEIKSFYISVDVARLGKDKSVIMVFHGLKLVDYRVFEKETTDVIINEIKRLQSRYYVPVSNIIIDTDGVGGGVADQFKGSVNFLNGSSPINKENYPNLKTQCYYKLTELVNEQWIDLSLIYDSEMKECIIEELEMVKRKNVDKDGKLEINSKEDMKRLLGRSPDYADCLMMRTYFLLKPTQIKYDVSSF